MKLYNIDVHRSIGKKEDRTAKERKCKIADIMWCWSSSKEEKNIFIASFKRTFVAIYSGCAPIDFATVIAAARTAETDHTS
jgi:hypothetical protein